MACCNQIVATNAGGIPYIVSTNTTIGTENINIALGVRRIQPVGYMTIIISNVIPADTTAALPVSLTLNDVTKALTLPNGTPVTAAELLNVSNILVFNDRTNGLLTLMSRTIA
jgi:hypothetical protein